MRRCKQATGGPCCQCQSVIFSSGGQLYSCACGRVNSYQQGSTDAFQYSVGIHSLEAAYVDGISLTHGAPGSHKHIWTFAAVLYETGSPHNQNFNCPCTDWPLEVYSYVGNNYFCAIGNPGPGYMTGSIVYADDPLWHGEGCGPVLQYKRY